MMKTRWLLILGLGGVNIPICAHELIKQEETMIVTPHRFIEPISTILAPVVVVMSDQLKREQPQSLPDILQQLPGISISRNGGLGQLASISIRGTNSSHVLLLIDGIRLPSTGVMGGVDVSQVPIGLIQRIEYLRGPLASTYGSDAIGGVINVITESQNLGGNLTLSQGSHGYQHYSLANRIELGTETTLAIGGDIQHSTGYRVQPSGYDAGKKGFKSQSVWLGVHHDFNSSFSGFIRGFGFTNTADYANTPFASENQKHVSSANYESGLHFSDDRYSSKWLGSVRYYRDVNYQKEFGKHSGKPLHVRLTSLQWDHHYVFDSGLRVNGGIDSYTEKVRHNMLFDTPKLARTNVGLYLTSQHSIDQVIVEGALRADKNQQYGYHKTWQAALSWAFYDPYRMTISHGTGFKAPSFNQILAVPGWGTVSNPHLKPETSQQSEIRFEGVNDRIHWEGSFYYNQIGQLITYKHDHYENEKSATIKGAEFSLDFMTWQITHNVSAEYINAKNDAGERLVRLPRHQLRYRIGQLSTDWSWDLTYRYLGKRVDRNFDVTPAQDVVLPAMHLFDIGISYKVLPKLWIHGKIVNIFNTYYETVFSYPSPGRELSFSLSYDF